MLGRPIGEGGCVNIYGIGSAYTTRTATIRFIQLVLGMEPVFEKVVEGLPREEAHEIERTLISIIGTQALGTGPLVNVKCKDMPTMREASM
jgi:hypothetical protein